MTTRSGQEKPPATVRPDTVAVEGNPRSLSEALDAIAWISDETDTNELWTEGMRDMDSHRPPGQRLFEGMD